MLLVPPLRSVVRPGDVEATDQRQTTRRPTPVIVPQMSTGATDRLYLRNAGIPVYGTTSIFDTVDGDRSHGKDERIPVEAFHTSGDYFYDLVKTLSANVSP
jgi:acetylornithine deacetylase/succinyl-diaminopimelate desuccinylase-like protein